MEFTKELEEMTFVCAQKGYGPAPIPQEGRYDQVYDSNQIFGLSHSAGTCAMKQGACKLTINVKGGIIQESLVEVVGCSGMTQSAMMASEILPGRTLQEALNTDLVCDAINVAMREIFLNISYGRTQTAFTQDGLAVGAAIEDLGNGGRSQLGTGYGSLLKGPRYLEVAEGYVTRMGLDEADRTIGYEYVNLGKMMDLIRDGEEPAKALEAAKGRYGRFDEASKKIDPRRE
jgi:NifU-like protein involved in Fe-S cluster formation